jgi:thioredoxin reductase (NADPH)
MELNLTGMTKDPTAKPAPVKMLVLGAGPAGMAAALYAARAELNPVLLTGMEMGGQAALTHTIENYPGFPEGVGGSQLGELFQKQAERFGAKVEFDTATAVDLTQRPIRVTSYNGEYLAETLVVATGATPVHLNVPGEIEFTGRGVSYCATCDGWFFREKNVVVVGGGDSALEEGIFLTRYANSVTIVHRRDTLRAGAVLQKRAFSNPKIKFVWNSVVSEIIGQNGVSAVKLKNTQTGEENLFSTDGVFIFIGHKPNSELFTGQLELDAGGYVKSDKLMQTNVPGVFAAGEVTDPTYRQVITSAGMGAAAAMQAIRFLEKLTVESSVVLDAEKVE